MEPEIVRVQETFRIDDAGSTVKVRVVLWKFGKSGPYTLEIPESEFSAERVKSEIERQAAELRLLIPPEPK